jgi:hypothetical protein
MLPVDSKRPVTNAEASAFQKLSGILAPTQWWSLLWRGWLIVVAAVFLIVYSIWVSGCLVFAGAASRRCQYSCG